VGVKVCLGFKISCSFYNVYQW